MDVTCGQQGSLYTQTVAPVPGPRGGRSTLNQDRTEGNVGMRFALPAFLFIGKPAHVRPPPGRRRSGSGVRQASWTPLWRRGVPTRRPPHWTARGPQGATISAPLHARPTGTNSQNPRAAGVATTLTANGKRLRARQCLLVAYVATHILAHPNDSGRITHPGTSSNCECLALSTVLSRH